jgi:hypothetical protein
MGGLLAAHHYLYPPKYDTLHAESGAIRFPFLHVWEKDHPELFGQNNLCEFSVFPSNNHNIADGLV